MATLLVIVSSPPYAGSDAAWNALRLAETGLDAGDSVRLFLINEGVDAGRASLTRPEGSFDLCAMLKGLTDKGAEIKYCKTCIDRCGVGTGEMAAHVVMGSMKELHRWVMTSDRVVTF